MNQGHKKDNNHFTAVQHAIDFCFQYSQKSVRPNREETNLKNEEKKDIDVKLSHMYVCIYMNIWIYVYNITRSLVDLVSFVKQTGELAGLVVADQKSFVEVIKVFELVVQKRPGTFDLWILDHEMSNNKTQINIWNRRLTHTHTHTQCQILTLTDIQRHVCILKECLIALRLHWHSICIRFQISPNKCCETKKRLEMACNLIRNSAYHPKSWMLKWNIN